MRIRGFSTPGTMSAYLAPLRNLIRNVNDGLAPDDRTMDLGGCESLLIQDNIVISDLTTPIRHNNLVGTVNTFHNLSSEGKLIRSTNVFAPFDKAPEVVTQVQADLDDTILASFLNL